jgi:hypothetical protein
VKNFVELTFVFPAFFVAIPFHIQSLLLPWMSAMLTDRGVQHSQKFRTISLAISLKHERSVGKSG